MPTLVMMHGMTGTAEMMQPFAEKILPSGWNLLVPQAEFEHPTRGYTWWRYEGEDNPGRRILSAKELADVDSSLLKLSNMLPDEEELVLGGFSQGGAMAQELLQFNHRVLGIASFFGLIVFVGVAWSRSARGYYRWLLSVLACAAIVQIGLGIATLLLHVPISLAALHQANALLLLTVSLWVAFVGRR